jgi:hypothetical protein
MEQSLMLKKHLPLILTSQGTKNVLDALDEK